MTGGLWVPDGKYRLECSLEGAESLNQEYEMHAGKTVVLLVHIVELPTRDGNPGGWALQVSELMAQQPVKGKTLTVLSLSSRKDLKVELGNTDRSWAGVAVKPGKVKRQSLEWPHGYVPVMLDGKRLGSIPVAASANYVVVFYDGFDRRVRLMQFKDRVFGAIP